jgi:PhzF family phenazine biosynthesis protein
MTKVAGELNLSETAFLHPDRGQYSLRWFTPTHEVPLCGHATLASAHVLFNEYGLSQEKPLEFLTKSGVLTARTHLGSIELNFPSKQVKSCLPPSGLYEALGSEGIFCAQSDSDYLVEYNSEDLVKSLTPDFSALLKLELRAVVVTARSQSFDFISRFFAPSVGISEDPVTGSAHCMLGPFWGQKLNKTALHAFQASKRGGELLVKLEGERVLLAGKAVTNWEGNLNFTF